MGKATGFLDYQRLEDIQEAPEVRCGHYEDFHRELPEAERREQGGRCMDCGVPFCQAGCRFAGLGSFGCPLHNLIPEWNDMVFRDNTRHALSRLLKTNNFPEFTGRVCPASCEEACVCNVHGEAVTIRDNELSIIETAFRTGLMQPRRPAVRSGRRVAVVGSGPAGLAAADQLNQRGHSVTVFERDDRPGGLLMYGIPNMKLPKDIVLRRVQLMEAEGVTFRTGVNVGKDISPEELLAEFDCVVLCCGAAKPRPYALADQGVKGVSYALPYLQFATRALLDRSAPVIDAVDRDVVVVGAGDTSSDCVATAIRQGCRSITQVIRKPQSVIEQGRCLWRPQPYRPDYAQEEAVARFGASPRRYETVVKELVTGEQGELRQVVLQRVSWRQEDGKAVMEPLAGTEETIPADLMLVASGFAGCEDYIGEAFGLTLERGMDVCAPNDQRIFLAGDLRLGASLVVHAIADGRRAARAADDYLMHLVD